MVLRSHDAYCLDSQSTRLCWSDDFLGDSLAAEWRAGGSAGGTIAVVDGETGGVARMTTDGDINDQMTLDWNGVRTLLTSKNVKFEIRAKLDFADATASCILYLRINDANRFGFYLSNIWVGYSQSAAGNEQFVSGLTPDTDYHVFRVEASSSALNFYVDDILEGTLSTYITALTLEAYLRLTTAENVAHVVDLDYVVLEQDI